MPWNGILRLGVNRHLDIIDLYQRYRSELMEDIFARPIDDVCREKSHALQAVGLVLIRYHHIDILYIVAYD